MKKLEQYRFRDGITPLSDKELNSRFFDLDARIHALEELKVQYEEIIAMLQNLSIERINSIFMPILLELKSETETELLELQQTIQAALNQVNELLEQLEGGIVNISRLRDGSAAITYTDSLVTKIAYTVPEGAFELNYAYQDDMLMEITAKLNNSTVWTKTYSYDQSGNLTGWTLV